MECEQLHFIKKSIQQLELTRTPLIAGKQSDPIILYSEFGYGRLEMYVLNPFETSLNDYRYYFISILIKVNLM